MRFFASVVDVRILPMTSCRSPKQEAADQKNSFFSHLLRHLAKSLCQAAACDTSTHTLISFFHCRMSKNSPFASSCFQEKGQSVTPNQPLLLSNNLWGKTKAKNITSNWNALILGEMPRFSGQWLELMETCLFETKSNFHINMMVGTHCMLLATVMEFTQWSHCFPMHIYLSESEIFGEMEQSR